MGTGQRKAMGKTSLVKLIKLGIWVYTIDQFCLHWFNHKSELGPVKDPVPARSCICGQGWNSLGAFQPPASESD